MVVQNLEFHFKAHLKEVKSHDFFDMKKYLNGSIMLEALEDFYWIGFNTKDKKRLGW